MKKMSDSLLELDFTPAFVRDDEGNYAPNSNMFYGPWSSIDDAWRDIEALFKDDSEDWENIVPIGLTIGIVNELGIIEEYWLNGGHKKENFVKKSGSTDDVIATVDVMDYVGEDGDFLPSPASYVANGLPVQSRLVNIDKNEIGRGDDGKEDVLVFFVHSDENADALSGNYYIFAKESVDEDKDGWKWLMTKSSSDVQTVIVDAFVNENQSANGTNKVYITIGGVKYAINAEAMVQPNKPTFKTKVNTEFNGSGTVAVNTVSGATTYYKKDSGAWTAYPTGGITLSQDATKKQVGYTIEIKATKLGLDSATPNNSGTFYVNRKVATPVITADGGEYSTSRTITITCGTSGATIYYKKKNDTSWNVYNSATKPTISGTSKTDETIKAYAAATDWVNSSEASTDLVVGRKKTYYGMGGATMTSAFTGLTALENSTLDGIKGTYDLAAATQSKQYIWVCIPKEVTTSTPQFVNESLLSIDEMNVAITTISSDYNCYRSISIKVGESSKLVIK